MTGFRARLYACFALVYLVWGSSFLVIRIGVTDLPPLLFAAGRAFIGGSVLLALALYRGYRLPSTAHEWKLMCFFSIVLIALSSGPSTFALKHLPSNEVALLNASLALMDSRPRHPRAERTAALEAQPARAAARLHRRGAAGLARGFSAYAARRLATAGAGGCPGLVGRNDHLPQHDPGCGPHRLQRDHHAARWPGAVRRGYRVRRTATLALGPVAGCSR